MKAIIVGPDNGGEGVYSLILENGEHIAEHYCSDYGYAPGDLWNNRKERQEKYADRNITEVVYLKDSGIDEHELLKRNKAWYDAYRAEKTDTQGTDLPSLDSKATSRQAEAQSGAGEKGRL